MTIKARPNMNGNTREDFERAYMALSDAMNAISAAERALLGDVANGRNYQHLEDADTATIADRRRIQNDMRTARALLGEIASDIVGTIEQ